MTTCRTINCAAEAPAAELPQAKSVSCFRPAVDVIEDAAEFRIVADVPGAASDALEIEFERGVLTLTARVAPRFVGQPGPRPIMQEYGVGDWRRHFRIGEGVDPDAARADYRDGVLTIRLPKTGAARRRSIAVNTN